MLLVFEPFHLIHEDARYRDHQQSPPPQQLQCTSGTWAPFNRILFGLCILLGPGNTALGSVTRSDLSLISSVVISSRRERPGENEKFGLRKTLADRHV